MNRTAAHTLGNYTAVLRSDQRDWFNDLAVSCLAENRIIVAELTTMAVD